MAVSKAHVLTSLRFLSRYIFLVWLINWDLTYTWKFASFRSIHFFFLPAFMYVHHSYVQCSGWCLYIPLQYDKDQVFLTHAPISMSCINDTKIPFLDFNTPEYGLIVYKQYSIQASVCVRLDGRALCVTNVLLNIMDRLAIWYAMANSEWSQ